MENGNKRRDRGGTHVQTLGTMSSTGLELHRKPATPGTPFALCHLPPLFCVRLRAANGKMFAIRYTGIETRGNARVNGT